MNIALLHPRWTSEYGFFESLTRSTSVWPPLILALLAALAEKEGHNVIIIDAEAENLSISKIIDRLRGKNINLIGTTSTTSFFQTATEMCFALKNAFPQIPIVIGGHHISALKEDAFYPCFDYAFIGEADISWVDFLKKYENDEDVTTVKGILYRKDGNIIFTGESTYLEDINTLPFPARHLLKSHLYNIGTVNGKQQFTSISSVRGCPFRCIFCCAGMFIRKKIRNRNPKDVIKEIKHVIKTEGTKYFSFLDDTLTLDRKHIIEICDLIIQEKLNITFEGTTRANLLDDELAKKLKEAGLTRLLFGLESVDENMRRLMRKEVPLKTYITANQICNKYGIESINACMLGLPGETHETLEKTLDFLEKYDEIKQATLTIAVPYPGTELYYMAKNKQHGLKLLTEDYSKYKRYNSAVMQVGNLSPKDLIEMQNYGLLSICASPKRLRALISRSQKKTLFLMLFRLIKYIYSLIRRSKNVTTRVFKIKH